MEKFKTVVDKKVNLELSRQAFIVYGVFGGCGLIGLVAGILFGSVLGYSDFSVIVILVACSMLVVLGAVLIVMLFNKIKKTVADNVSIETEFLEEEVYAVSFKGEEKTAESRIRYEEFLFYKETKDYVYLFPNKYTALPLKKNEELISFLAEKNIKKKLI